MSCKVDHGEYLVCADGNMVSILYVNVIHGSKNVLQILKLGCVLLLFPNHGHDETGLKD